MGAVAILVGAVLTGFDPLRWDVVILTLPRHHGIHLTDAVGMVLVTLGIVVLWRLPHPRSACTNQSRPSDHLYKPRRGNMT